MKTARPRFLVAIFFLSLLAARFALAQDSSNFAASPTTVASSSPYLPPPPPAYAPSSLASPSFNRSSPAPVQRTLGVAVPQSQVHLNQHTALTIWTSETQMNNYFFNLYLLSGRSPMQISVTGVSPDFAVDPMARLVLAQNLKLNGANITAVESYRLDKLELIGLAKHDPPMAFVINRHSAFEVLRQSGNSNRGNTRGAEPVTPTDIRPLTEFEQQALAEIKSGQDLSIQPQSDGSLLAVGAMRAQAACLQCHTTAQAGDALGAFSYRLSKASLFDNLSAASDSHLPTASASAPAGQ